MPEAEVYAAALDREINERGFIMPGLGDAGDRLYGTRWTPGCASGREGSPETRAARPVAVNTGAMNPSLVRPVDAGGKRLAPRVGAPARPPLGRYAAELRYLIVQSS